ncbi:hypothetical protein OSB04_027060 [Centaurea solstitialis]|uniref:DUF223 domain-containing protein n=1 Tax=Centaurea solstitialis TaxID=347529 RepID=A0AA38SCR5_9ASTR|nr:hypothetical protein OSB04_027060 [Centaurea solstitialis]
MDFVNLRDLREDNESWAIKVRVCRLWESLNSKKNGDLISLDMVFIDEMGTLMATTIRKNLVSKFKHLLKEGLVYSVKNFKVVRNSGDYRVVNSEFKIIFTLLTTVKRVEENEPSIPLHGFEYGKEKTVNTRVNDDTILTDIIGCITEIGDMETVGGGYTKGTWKLLRITRSLAKLHCGENLVKNLWTNIQLRMRSPNNYYRVINFSTSSASKIYLNLQDNYVSSLESVFAHVCPRLKLMDTMCVAPKTVEEKMFDNRMSIEQLLRADWKDESKGYSITIMGVIDKFETHCGWFYLACKGCCRRVTPLDGFYKCGPCGIESDVTLTLYKLHFVVKDDTGVTTCVILHKLAERMVDSSALKLLNKSDPNSNEFPREILELCDYNIKRGSDQFSVHNVFEPTEDLEKRFLSTYQEKKTCAKQKTCASTSGTISKGISTENDAPALLLDEVDGDIEAQQCLASISPTKRRKIIMDDESDDEGGGVRS